MNRRYMVTLLLKNVFVKTQKENKDDNIDSSTD